MKAIFEGCHVAGKLHAIFREHERICSATIHESAVNECQKNNSWLYTRERSYTEGLFFKGMDLVKNMRFQSKMEWCEHKPKTPQVIREVNETAPRRVIAKVLTSNIGVKRHNVKER